ncbi:demethylmenaquinone methyltransferase [Buchananella hordeovulneris]|uniref:Demethylmenaquinone methyltransferase n=1 Tax=Buchananella hordeovulneris TaxID=52770 RepID=A0A1Q5PYX6_9ACTO|nr:demethylmenaquinone methyltransferase [Buchananella hordeovulneris]MDO5081032.1 demethylmenaquinone methyltransferase [Buchananella hordeovulneris]OKL52662.1 bifunctional demethylmenaquinone methyltransferase/2-methoxy-6-polyprenyl-1,4-benzoquinol methylase [Buchananella hordeovulneris]RRD43764.1 demethylmenaquinone methyltransferase [Buchananella hordeovulneris]RRD51958.1 demethylmenaquinone methyltransferase [Buchananella hordeovulneris]
MRASLDKQPAEVAGMFDRVAKRYDLTNDVLSLGQDRLWRRATRRAVGARPGMRVLDLGAGTGTSAAQFARAGADVVACDFSPGMIAQGRRRYPHLTFVQGDATDLPFADAEFDAVTISFALRNVQGTERALREMLRVTKPGGHLVVCEFSTPTGRPTRGVYELYLRQLLPRLARVFSSNVEAYDYLAESILAWPKQQELAQLLSESGWQRVGYHNLSGGIVALHRGFAPR